MDTEIYIKLNYSTHLEYRCEKSIGRKYLDSLDRGKFETGNRDQAVKFLRDLLLFSNHQGFASGEEEDLMELTELLAHVNSEKFHTFSCWVG